MCLILFAWQHHSNYPLVVVANRDEFYERPTQEAHFWEQHPHILAGKDLLAGGTWLGVTKDGRFTAITNYRDGNVAERKNAPSRGQLTTDFLTGSDSPEAYCQKIADQGHLYNGFNLLVGDKNELWYYSNRSDEDPVSLPPGVYGLSNRLLDTPWFKVRRGKFLLKQQLQSNNLHPRPFLDLLNDEDTPTDEELPNTGISEDWERLLASIFIKSENYGTRCSSVLLRQQTGKVMFIERVYRKDQTMQEDIFSFSIGGN